MFVVGVETLNDGETVAISAAERAIFDAVALNARDLGALGLDGVAMLERRLIEVLLPVVERDYDSPSRLLQHAIFWMMVSVARGVVADDQHTGGEGAMAVYLMDKMGIDNP